MIHRSYLSRVVLIALLLSSLSACTYLIPDDPSVPRYNQVLGERHKPERNGDGAGPQSSASDIQPAPDMNAAVSSPVTPVAVNNLPALPPVDAATQAQAQKEMSGSTPQIATRQMPVENMTLAANSNAPDISSVPPRPPLTGPDATKTHLDDVRRDLEQERTSSGFAKTQLSKDAAAEPSLQTPADNATTPVIAPPAPVMEAPLPPPQSAITPPAPGSASAGFIPPAPVLTPPPPPMPLMASASANPAFAPAPPMPAPAMGQAPIQLTPPPMQLTPPSSMQASAPRAQLASASPMPGSYVPSGNGGFDPLATAPASVTTGSSAAYASSGFLPQSRYADRR